MILISIFAHKFINIFYPMQESNNNFKNWINSKPRFERVYWINKIAIECGVSKITVTSWTKRDKPIRAAYGKVINEITGLELFPIAEMA